MSGAIRRVEPPPGPRPATPYRPPVPLLDVAAAAPILGGRPVAAGASFALDPGRTVALVGANGAGKTSLLRAILGLLPHAGAIRWDDRPVAGLGRRDLARLAAYLPQKPIDVPGQTVRDLLMLGRVPHLGPFGGESPADHRA